MINKFTITGDKWTKITNSGNSGTCWVLDDNKTVLGNCKIFHSTENPTDSDLELSYPVFKPKGQNKLQLFSSANMDDCYYARMDNVNGVCQLCVDTSGGIGYQREIDTVEQSQTEKIVRCFLMQELKSDIVLTVPAQENDTTITVSAGHGFTAIDGEMLEIFDESSFTQIKVVSVDGNILTLEYPLDTAHDIDSILIRGNINLNKDFSTNNTQFKFKLHNEKIPIDITELNVVMTHAPVGDDGKFGGITALTKGLFFRRENHILTNYGNYKCNGDFLLNGFNVNYNAKGPGGTESTQLRINYQNTFGKEIRMYENDSFYCVVRDNLSTLTCLKVSILGSYTFGE